MFATVQLDVLITNIITRTLWIVASLDDTRNNKWLRTCIVAIALFLHSLRHTSIYFSMKRKLGQKGRRMFQTWIEWLKSRVVNWLPNLSSRVVPSIREKHISWYKSIQIWSSVCQAIGNTECKSQRRDRNFSKITCIQARELYPIRCLDSICSWWKTSCSLCALCFNYVALENFFWLHRTSKTNILIVLRFTTWCGCIFT